MKNYKINIVKLAYLLLVACVLAYSNPVFARTVRGNAMQDNLAVIKDRFNEDIADGLLHLELDGREIGKEVLSRIDSIGGLESILILEVILQDNLENVTDDSQGLDWVKIAHEISFFFDADSKRTQRQWINKGDVISQMQYTYPNRPRGAVVSADGSFTYNFTGSVAECLAISLYDEDAHILGLMHLKPDKFLSEEQKFELWMDVIDETFRRLKDRGADLNNLKARIIGGSVYISTTGEYIFKTQEERKASVRRTLKIYQVLSDLGIPIVESDILRTERSTHLIASSHDGLFYNVRP